MIVRTLTLAVLFLFGASPCAAQIQPRVVALRNQVAPGTDDTFQGFGAPTIASTSDVAFYARLHYFGGDPSLAGGIWSDTDGSLSLVARRGTVPSGYPPGSGFFFPSSDPSTTRSPIALEGGQVAFGALLNNQAGVWAGSPSSDSQAAIWAGLPAPTGSPGTVFLGADGDSLRTVQSGQMISLGTLQTGVGGVTASNAAGIWTGTPGSLDLVARQGSLAPSTSGTYSAFQFPVLNDNGISAFAASLKTGNGVTSGNNAGVWSGTPGALQLLARKGDVAPGTGGQSFQEFQQVAINDAGTVLLSAQTFPSNSSGLWRSDGGVLSPIVVPGQSMPGLAGDINLVGTTSAVINGHGVIAFEAFFQGADVGTFQDRSLWIKDNTDLRMIAKVGDVVPGTNGTVTFDGSFTPFLNNSGIVAFASNVAIDGFGTVNAGLFAYDLQGNLLKSILYGDQIEVAPGDIRSVTSLSLPVTFDNVAHTFEVGSGGQDGRPSPLNDKNELAFRASFGLFDDGVFVITVPEPSSLILGGLAGCALLGFARLRKKRPSGLGH